MSSLFTSAADLFRALMLAAAAAPDDVHSHSLADYRPAEEGEPADVVMIDLQTRAARAARAAGQPLPSLQDGAAPMVAVHGPQRMREDMRLTFTYSTGPGSRSSMRLDGTRLRLERMADHVRKHWTLYGGGPKPAELLRPVKPRTGPTWKPAQLRAWLYMLETKEYGDALAAGDALGAVFYPGSGASGVPIILAAPAPIEGMPDGFVTGLRDDGKWSAFHVPTGHSIIGPAGSAGSRARAESLARDYAASTAERRGVTVEQLLTDADKRAQAADTAAARAAWCKLRGIEDPAAPAEAPADVDMGEALADAAPELAAAPVADAPVSDCMAAIIAAAAAPADPLPPIDIRIGDTVHKGGHAYTVEGPIKERGRDVGVHAARTVSPGHVETVFLRGDDAIRARLAADAAPAAPAHAPATCSPARAAALALRRLTMDAAPCAGRADAIRAGLADDPAALAELVRLMDVIRRGGPPVDRAEAGRALAELEALAAPAADPGPGGQAAPADRAAPAASAAIVGHPAPAAVCCADATVSGPAGPVFVPPPTRIVEILNGAAPAADAALPWQVLAAQPTAIYATPVQRIGKHEWCTVVYAHPLYVACTDQVWRRVDANAGTFKRSRDWPTYDSNRGHGGMPVTLAKLYAQHEGDIQRALADVRELRLPAWCAGHVLETARQGLGEEARRAEAMARTALASTAAAAPLPMPTPALAPAAAPALADPAPAAPVHPPAPRVATSAHLPLPGVAVSATDLDPAPPAAASSPGTCSTPATGEHANHAHPDPKHHHHQRRHGPCRLRHVAFGWIPAAGRQPGAQLCGIQHGHRSVPGAGRATSWRGPGRSGWRAGRRDLRCAAGRSSRRGLLAQLSGGSGRRVGPGRRCWPGCGRSAQHHGQMHGRARLERAALTTRAGSSVNRCQAVPSGARWRALPARAGPGRPAGRPAPLARGLPRGVATFLAHPPGCSDIGDGT